MFLNRGSPPETLFRWAGDNQRLGAEVKRLVAMIADVSLLRSPALTPPPYPPNSRLAQSNRYLNGDPYGKTANEVAKERQASSVSQDGNTKACGAKKGPARELHVLAVTENKDQFNNEITAGYLVLDASTAKFCAQICRY